MKYYVTTDLRGYVLSVVHTGTIRDYVELNLEDYDLTKIRAYKLGKNKLIFDAEEWKRIEDENQHKADEKEISELEQKLADTDYIFAKYCEELLAMDNPLTWISDVIKLNVRYTKQYSETIKNRKKWRERIEELRGNNT